MLKKYDGTKSQKLQSMINEKLHKARRRELGSVKNVPAIKSIINEIKAFKHLEHKINKKIKALENRYMIEVSTGEYSGGKITIRTNESSCIVPRHTIDDLQRAQDFQSLGNAPAAKKIWDSVIKEYGLCKMP
jgi:hypothetical protein